MGQGEQSMGEVEDLMLVEDFVLRWGLDHTASQLLSSLMPDVQERVLKDFRPVEGTRDVNGRLRAFIKSVSSSAEDHSRHGHFAPQGGVVTFAQRWGLQEDCVQFLHSLPPEVLGRVMREFRPNGETMNVSGRLRAFARSVSASMLQADAVSQFAQKWGLEEDSVQFLRTLPSDVLQRVLTGFTPKADTNNIGGRLRAFTKSVMTTVRTPSQTSLAAAVSGVSADCTTSLPVAEASYEELYQTFVHFATSWGLDGDAWLLLQQLPEPLARQVMAEFVPSGLESIAEQFHALVMSALTSPTVASPVAPAAVQTPLILPPQAPTGPPESIPEFLERWGLSVDAAAFLEGLPAETLQIVLKDFTPAGDTKSVLGRLMGFARNIGKGGSGHIASASQVPAASPVMGQVSQAQPTAALPVEGLEFFIATWCLDDETVKFLQALPSEVLPRIMREFTPNQDTRNVGGRLRAFARSILQASTATTHDPVQQFVEQWGLDASTAAFLQALPDEVRAKVMLGFHPNGDTVNLQGRLQAFARGVLARSTPSVDQQAARAGPISAFAGRWGLDNNSVTLLGTLPPDMLQRVVTEFKPPSDTFNVDGRLQSFVKSVASASGGKRSVEGFAIAPPVGLQQAKRPRC